MRKLFACCLLVLPVFCAHGQDQERKLVDRIMKPDMSLENESQKKKFTADRTSVNKQAHVSSFYLQQRSPGKSFTGTRDFSATKFNAHGFAQRDRAAAGTLSAKQASTGTYSEASKTLRTENVFDQNKAQPSRDYSGNRPFVEQGKSQKSLNRKNEPMTIDQVRELLNKNR